MKKRVIVPISIIVAIVILIVIGTRIVRIETDYNVAHDYDDIIKRGAINVAVNYSPISYHIEGDSITGFDFELLQMLSEVSGIEFNIHPEASYARSIDLLNNRTYDIVAQQIPITSENKQEYIFSKPLLLNKQVLIQRIDSTGNTDIRNQLDLKGCTLHIAQDTPTRLRIENLAQEIGDTIHICEMPDYGAEQPIILVATGEIDYAVCDEASAVIIAEEYDNIDYSTDISFTQFMSWTMRKESTSLCDSINSWLSVVQESDKYKQLYTRYFGTKSYYKHQRINNNTSQPL